MDKLNENLKDILQKTEEIIDILREDKLAYNDLKNAKKLKKAITLFNQGYDFDIIKK